MKHKLISKIFITCIVIGIFFQMLNLNVVSADNNSVINYSIQYNVQNTLSPNITGEYKTWKQFDSQWGSMAMPGGGDLAAYGCAISSAAILTVHARLTDESKMDPGKLLTFLENNGGLTSGGGIYWSKVSQMIPNFDYAGSINLSGTDNEKIATIKNYINRGYYIIANVNSGGHFVAVDRYVGDSIIIMDPGSSTKNDLFSGYSGSGVIGLRIFTAPNPPPPGTANDLITSIGEEHWAAGYIRSLSSLGIMSGYNDGTYKPDNSITRAEIIKMLAVAYKKYDSAAVYDKFTDVTRSQWYYSYIASAVNSGIADSAGTGNGKFKPDSAISRESMITFTARCLTIIEGYSWLSDSAMNDELAVFSDSYKISSWAKSSVALCVRNGIINGYVDAKGVLTFNPSNYMKRGEVAKVVDSIL